VTIEQIDRRAVQAQPAYGVIDRFAEQPAVNPVEVIRREVGHAGQGIEIQRVVEVLSEIVSKVRSSGCFVMRWRLAKMR
jgi:hypothetical protein